MGGMITRTGKIGRLPEKVRTALNERLDDGETGADLAAWLNGLPEVQKMLAARFGGRPITEHHLSEWRQGGFAEWKKALAEKAMLEGVIEQWDELDMAARDTPMADRMMGPLLVALTQMLREAMDGEVSPEKRRTVLGVAQQISMLRRGCREAERQDLKWHKWSMERIDRQAAEAGEQVRREAFDRVIRGMYATGSEKSDHRAAETPKTKPGEGGKSE
jgi:hypothetical protein